jgi:hypothetical protein
VFLASCPPGTVGIVRALRSAVRRHAPDAAEAIKFHSICFYYPGAHFGSIGGNVCMIEDRREGVRLSFIIGKRLEDPSGLLCGAGKSKRFVDIATIAQAKAPTIAALIQAAARRARRAASTARPARTAPWSPPPRGSPPR